MFLKQIIPLKIQQEKSEMDTAEEECVRKNSMVAQVLALGTWRQHVPGDGKYVKGTDGESEVIHDTTTISEGGYTQHV